MLVSYNLMIRKKCVYYYIIIIIIIITIIITNYVSIIKCYVILCQWPWAPEDVFQGWEN